MLSIPLALSGSLKTLPIPTPLRSSRNNIFICEFAKNCLKNEKVKTMFPIRKLNHCMEIRKMSKYEMIKANTKRYEQSANSYMRRILNNDWKEDKKHSQI